VLSDTICAVVSAANWSVLKAAISSVSKVASCAVVSAATWCVGELAELGGLQRIDLLGAQGRDLRWP
jgi:hypothetical protein